MTEAISFPNLGITFQHVGRAISIFGFDIAYYGILIGLAILAGVGITLAEVRRTRQNPDDYLDLTIVTVIFSIIGARLYYVVFNWQMYKDNPAGIFNIRQGGLAIYGGILAGIVTVFVFAAVRQMSAATMLDTVCIGLAAGQMIGRWGNFFNREAFGEYTDSLFAMRLPIEAVRVSDITDRMRNHIETVDGVHFIQAHPTFLYESVWCMLLLILLLVHRYRTEFEGELFLIYLGGYGLGRFWIEVLRTDQLLIPILKWPVSQVLSAVLVFLSILLFFYNRAQEKRNRMHRMRERERRKRAKSSRNMFHER